MAISSQCGIKSSTSFKRELLKSERRRLGTKNADPHQYHAPFTDTKDPFQQNVNTFVKPSRCFFYEENKHKGRAMGGSLLGIEPITTYAQSKFLLIFIPVCKTIVNSFYNMSVILKPYPTFLIQFSVKRKFFWILKKTEKKILLN